MNETNKRSHEGGLPTPDELKRRGDAIRADLDRTLEALERKLSPREIASRSAAYLREHSSEVLDRIGHSMRGHPVSLLLGLLLGAAGLAWMTTAIIRKRRGNRDDDDSRSYYRRKW